MQSGVCLCANAHPGLHPGYEYMSSRSPQIDEELFLPTMAIVCHQLKHLGDTTLRTQHRTFLLSATWAVALAAACAPAWSQSAGPLVIYGRLNTAIERVDAS